MNNFDDLFNNSPAGEQGGTQLSPGSPRNAVSWGGREDYAAKKQSERDAIFELSDHTALEVASNGDTFQHYLDVQSTFDRYSAVNALLILAQNHEATRIGDFDYWKAKGGYVNKGESSIVILEPHTYTKEDGSPGTGFNLKKVFDISQVDTRKMKAPAPEPNYTDRQLLQALISKAPVKITGVDDLPGDLGAMTDPETGEIYVRRGMEFAETFKSVAWELSLTEIERSGTAPTDANFSAYSAAYMLCKKHGVDTREFAFFDVSSVFEGMDAQAVKGELSQIRNAAENISGRMAKHLDAVSKAAKSQDAR